MSPPSDNAEHVERVACPFPWELVIALILMVLLPMTISRESGRWQSVRYMERLFLKLPCLVLMMGLCVSVVRNKQRSGVAKVIASAGALLTTGLLYEPFDVLIHYLLL